MANFFGAGRGGRVGNFGGDLSGRGGRRVNAMQMRAVRTFANMPDVEREIQPRHAYRRGDDRQNRGRGAERFDDEERGGRSRSRGRSQSRDRGESVERPLSSMSRRRERDQDDIRVHQSVGYAIGLALIATNDVFVLDLSEDQAKRNRVKYVPMTGRADPLSFNSARGLVLAFQRRLSDRVTAALKSFKSTYDAVDDSTVYSVTSADDEFSVIVSNKVENEIYLKYNNLRVTFPADLYELQPTSVNDLRIRLGLPEREWASRISLHDVVEPKYYIVSSNTIGAIVSTRTMRMREPDGVMVNAGFYTGLALAGSIEIDDRVRRYAFDGGEGNDLFVKFGTVHSTAHFAVGTDAFEAMMQPQCAGVFAYHTFDRDDIPIALFEYTSLPMETALNSAFELPEPSVQFPTLEERAAVRQAARINPTLKELSDVLSSVSEEQILMLLEQRKKVGMVAASREPQPGDSPTVNVSTVSTSANA